jgi:hypothetical protein
VAADDQGAHRAAGIVGRQTDQGLLEVAGDGVRVARAGVRCRQAIDPVRPATDATAAAARPRRAGRRGPGPVPPRRGAPASRRSNRCTRSTTRSVPAPRPWRWRRGSGRACRRGWAPPQYGRGRIPVRVGRRQRSGKVLVQSQSERDAGHPSRSPIVPRSSPVTDRRTRRSSCGSAGQPISTPTGLPSR